MKKKEDVNGISYLLSKSEMIAHILYAHTVSILFSWMFYYAVSAYWWIVWWQQQKKQNSI